MQDTDFQAGDVVGGKWRVNRLVGVGGMGAVYHASHATMDLPAALKIVLTKSATRADLDERIRLEAKALAVLKNPHVVRILDAGLHERDCFYVAMDFLEGQPLRKVMHNIGQLPLEAALLIAHGIAMGLSAIHEKKIVHRDLKPENVMMEKGEPIIIDLGLAKVRAFAVRTTSKPFSFGTPQYMSPEQLLGENAKIDAASDVYALGVMLYEMLAGRHPQADATGLLPDGKVAGLRRIYGEVKPLSSLRQGLPSGLEPLVFELMRWEPSERPSAVDTARRLRLLLRELGSVAREPSSGDVLPDRSRAQYAMRETKSEQRFPHLDTEPTRGPVGAGAVQVVVRGAEPKAPAPMMATAPMPEALVRAAQAQGAQAQGAQAQGAQAAVRPTPRQGTAAMPAHAGPISPHPPGAPHAPSSPPPATSPHSLHSPHPETSPRSPSSPRVPPTAQPVQTKLAQAPSPAVSPAPGPVASEVASEAAAATSARAHAASTPLRALARVEPSTGAPVSRSAEARDTRGTAAIVVLLATFSVIFFAWGYFDRRAKKAAESASAAAAATESAPSASSAEASALASAAPSAIPSAAPSALASAESSAAPSAIASAESSAAPSVSAVTTAATATTATTVATVPTVSSPPAPSAPAPPVTAKSAAATTPTAATTSPKPKPVAPADDDDLMYRTKGKTP